MGYTCVSCITCCLHSDYNVARAVGGATCEASSYSDSDHTCREALLGNDSHWETDGEGSGAWIKVSFPRANVGRLGILSGCGTLSKIRTITVDMDSTGDGLFEVCYQAGINVELPKWQSNKSECSISIYPFRKTFGTMNKYRQGSTPCTCGTVCQYTCYRH